MEKNKDKNKGTEIQLICCKCNVSLKTEKTEFSYIGHNFYADLLRCEVCGQVYLPQSMVEKKINQVEMDFEDK